MTNLTADQCRTYFSSRLDGQRITSHAQLSLRCPFHDDGRASLSIHLEKGAWKCHAGCGEGGILDFEQLYSRCDRDAAREKVNTLLGGAFSRPGQQPEAVYTYTDSRGSLVFEKRRFPGKRFQYRHKDANGRWVYDLKGIERKPLYRLHELITAQSVIIVEGEKDAENVHAALKSLGHSGRIAVTTNHDGAGHWKREYAPYFAGRSVVILADNDEPGRQHAQQVAASVYPHAVAVKIVELSGLPDKGDVSNYLEQHTPAELMAEIKAQKTAWSPVTANANTRLIRVADVKPLAVDWLWEGRIAKGTLTILDGDPGRGKGLFCCDLTMRLTSGKDMPDGSPAAIGPVIYLTTEDAISFVVRPRLDVAGANVEHVHMLPPGSESLIKFPDSIELLKEEVQQRNAALIIVDPLSAFLGEQINSHKDADIRRALAPLHQLAESTGVAVLGVRHLRKADGPAMYRGGMSIAITAAARCVITFGPNPEDESEGVMAWTKINVGPKPRSLRYQIMGTEHPSLRDKYNKPVNVPKLRWLGESNATADDLVQPAEEPERRSQIDEACEIIEQLFGEHTEILSSEADKAMRQAHIGHGTIMRAREKMGVRSRRNGESWYWCLTRPVRKSPSLPKPEKMDS